MQEWEFGVLGPLRVRHAGTSVPIPAAKQRVLLTALVMAGRDTVSAGRLMNYLWGETPPPSARNTVKNYALRLRRALTDDSGTSPILTTPNGYRLATPVQAVDLHRFQALEGRARAEATAGALATADDLLRQALRLWRGTPLADVPSDLIQQEIVPGLTERHLATVEFSFDLELRRGRHDAVVTDLHALSRQHPLRERLLGLSMLALYRCGRAAEALTAYHDAVTTLRDELGTDPSPELRALHEQILRQDPALHLRGTPPAASRPPTVARQLPGSPPGFVGRHHALRQLDELLERARRERTVALAVLSGPGGIGKTSVALHWAHQHLTDFPDGQLYVNLRGFDPSGSPISSDDAVRSCCVALGADPATLPAEFDALHALCRTLLTDRRILLLLDNARDAAQVLPLLPGSASCLVLVTSRNHLPALAVQAGARLLMLEAFDEHDATVLLSRQLGDDRTSADPAAVAAITRWCAGLPLALRVVAARAAQRPGFTLADLACELRDAATRLDRLNAGDDHTSVAAALSWSYHALPATVAQTLGLLAHAPGPDLNRDAAASLTDSALPQLNPVLLHLEAASLLVQHRPGRYLMHDLTRLYAAQRATADLPADSLNAALRRLADYYVRTADHADRVMTAHAPRDRGTLAPPPTTTPTPFDTPTQALTWFDTERLTLLATQQLAATRGWHHLVVHLAWLPSTYQCHRGLNQDRIHCWQLAITAAQHIGDPGLVMAAHRFLGDAYGRVGDHARALHHLELALNHAEHDNDLLAQAHTHRGLTEIFSRHGDHHAAHHAWHHALTLYEADDRNRDATRLRHQIRTNPAPAPSLHHAEQQREA
ncbi:BTAD domain-containing putative transcriptional regulator [Amycolatopsis sp. 195334CR]|uniref:AfsR/SARP family transcriptional regulator n=1 Tax=Amycolatopsis sp. 195334CR TaxID=2814588 RepID=UPI001A8E465D|nr:BTAD domain-containing putative transcriptional regulator [Amycolatopsis sp. 195334CR]MBN6034086.1 winged helix-turn-helix domain-containing protein [Amycolatopsis sp. 195334CR]